MLVGFFALCPLCLEQIFVLLKLSALSNLSIMFLYKTKVQILLPLCHAKATFLTWKQFYSPASDSVTKYSNVRRLLPSERNNCVCKCWKCTGAVHIGFYPLCLLCRAQIWDLFEFSFGVRNFLLARFGAWVTWRH